MARTHSDPENHHQRRCLHRAGISLKSAVSESRCTVTAPSFRRSPTQDVDRPAYFLRTGYGHHRNFLLWDLPRPFPHLSLPAIHRPHPRIAPPGVCVALAYILWRDFALHRSHRCTCFTQLARLFTWAHSNQHWVLTIDRLFLAFVTVDNGVNPLKFYGDYSQATQIEQSTFLLVSLAIADALVVSILSHRRKHGWH